MLTDAERAAIRLKVDEELKKQTFEVGADEREMIALGVEYAYMIAVVMDKKDQQGRFATLMSAIESTLDAICLNILGEEKGDIASLEWRCNILGLLKHSTERELKAAKKRGRGEKRWNSRS